MKDIAADANQIIPITAKRRRLFTSERYLSGRVIAQNLIGRSGEREREKKIQDDKEKQQETSLTRHEGWTRDGGGRGQGHMLCFAVSKGSCFLCRPVISSSCVVVIFFVSLCRPAANQ